MEGKQAVSEYFPHQLAKGKQKTEIDASGRQPRGLLGGAGALSEQ